jgi:hypothetical protein
MKRNDYDGDGPPDLSRELEAADKIILNQDKELAHLRQQLADGAFTARMVGAIERQRPLCPDHRDKQIGKPCLACTVETLERERDEARALLREACDSIDGWKPCDSESVMRVAQVTVAWYEAARAAGGGK